MLKIEEIEKILNEDQGKKKDLGVITDSIANEIKGSIEKRVQQLKDKLNKLLERKKEILWVPLTKAETLEAAKSALQENRRLYLDEFLVKHLSNCQIQNVDNPLSPRTLFLDIFHRDDYWKLAYWIITEKDLEKAAETLPDIGLSSTERNAQIKKIDMEIAGLKVRIEKELKNL